ncbi:MAG: glyoxalase/bleomycin resistance protein/dioxygenase [Dehalococcoidales bacterium]|nr:glyoxalase/bleomycin resistance protein/dioxygenase [Dehalococcoidales bacterium]
MPRIGQIGIRCRDLEKSVRFYRDILGLEEYARLESADHHRIVALRGGPVELELIATDPKEKPLEVEGRAGLNHFAFYVRNLDEMLNELRKKGVKILGEPRDFSKDIRTAFFEDPDGVRVELVQFSGERARK